MYILQLKRRSFEELQQLGSKFEHGQVLMSNGQEKSLLLSTLKTVCSPGTTAAIDLHCSSTEVVSESGHRSSSVIKALRSRSIAACSLPLCNAHDLLSVVYTLKLYLNPFGTSLRNQ